MDITITIPNDKRIAVIDAFANQYNYQEEIEDENHDLIPNPQSKGQFALAKIKNFIKEVYVANSVKTFNDGRNTVKETAETDMSGVEIA